MQNIIRDRLTLEQLTEFFASPAPTRLLPPLGSAPWQQVASNPVAANWISQIDDLASKEAAEPLPVLTDALYAQFHQTGNRLRFERLYFERRRRLARAAMAALTASAPEMRERFVASTLAKAADIFAEESWSLPAHVANPSGKDPMRIDLFAAETANLFDELLSLFPDRMSGVLAAIKLRLRTQFFENYLADPPP